MYIRCSDGSNWSLQLRTKMFWNKNRFWIHKIKYLYLKLTLSSVQLLYRVSKLFPVILSHLLSFNVFNRGNESVIISTHSSSISLHSLKSKISKDGQCITNALTPAIVNFGIENKRLINDFVFDRLSAYTTSRKVNFLQFS